MADMPPPYRFFQSVFVPSDSHDPAPLIDPQLSHTLPVGAPAPVSRKIQIHVFDRRTAKTARSSMMEVIVHTSSRTQRTWFIQKTILGRHSSYLRAACADASTVALDLADHSLATFQDFLDFSHSNIYSVNKRAPDYHIIHSHIQAWVLGAKLEAPNYQAAALRELYTWIEPLARAVNSSAKHSPIRIEDVDFVCRKTQQGSVLRFFIFDAVAAHWTQDDAVTAWTDYCRDSKRNQGAPEAGLDSIEASSWADLYTKYPEFRKRISVSLGVRDGKRDCLLRPLKEYAAGKLSKPQAEIPLEAITNSFSRARPRALRDRGHMRSPSRRRSSSASSEGLQRGSSRERTVDEDVYMTLDDA